MPSAVTDVASSVRRLLPAYLMWPRVLVVCYPARCSCFWLRRRSRRPRFSGSESAAHGRRSQVSTGGMQAWRRSQRGKRGREAANRAWVGVGEFHSRAASYLPLYARARRPAFSCLLFHRRGAANVDDALALRRQQRSARARASGRPSRWKKRAEQPTAAAVTALRRRDHVLVTRLVFFAAPPARTSTGEPLRRPVISPHRRVVGVVVEMVATFFVVFFPASSFSC